MEINKVESQGNLTFEALPSNPPSSPLLIPEPTDSALTADGVEVGQGAQAVAYSGTAVSLASYVGDEVSRLTDDSDSDAARVAKEMEEEMMRQEHEMMMQEMMEKEMMEAEMMKQEMAREEMMQAEVTRQEMARQTADEQERMMQQKLHKEMAEKERLKAERAQGV